MAPRTSPVPDRGFVVQPALFVSILALVLATIPKAESQASFCRLNGPDKCVGRQHILEEQVSWKAALTTGSAVLSMVTLEQASKSRCLQSYKAEWAA